MPRRALKVDPSCAKISKGFHENPQAFADAFAKAWFKMTHRDMGPVSRYLGPRVPAQPCCGRTLFPLWITNWSASRTLLP